MSTDELATAAEEEATEPESVNLSLADLGARLGKKPSPQKSAEGDGETEATGESEQDQTEETPTDLSQTEQQSEQTEETTETQETGNEDEDRKAADEVATEAEAKGIKAKAIGDLRGRVHKLVDQRDAERNARLALEQRIADLEGKQTQGGQEQQQAMPRGGSPFDANPQVQQLDAAIEVAERRLNWIEENPQGGEYDEGGKKFELNSDQVRQLKAQSDRDRIRLISDRATTVADLKKTHQVERQKSFQEAAKVYPWIQNKDSAEFKEALEVIRQNPGVTLRPDMELVVGDYIAGRKARLDKAKAGKPGARPRGSNSEPPHVVTKSGAAAPRMDSKQKQLGEAETQFKKSGSISDLKTLLAAKRNARH